MGNCLSNSRRQRRNCVYLDHKLQTATFKNTPKFLPSISVAKVVKVYDGDTITVAGKLDNQEKIYRWTIRLNNIDTPELNGPTENEKEIAKLAKKRLRDRLMPRSDGEIVALKIFKYDKYGRLLCDVFHNGQCINDWLMYERLAVQYNGGTKLPVDWVKYYRTGKI